MRKGVKCRSLGVPIERRTTAPAPSDCSRARKENLISRGVVMFVVVDVSRVGITGSPRKGVVVEVVGLVVAGCMRCMMLVKIGLAC